MYKNETRKIVHERSALHKNFIIFDRIKMVLFNHQVDDDFSNWIGNHSSSILMSASYMLYSWNKKKKQTKLIKIKRLTSDFLGKSFVKEIFIPCYSMHMRELNLCILKKNQNR